MNRRFLMAVVVGITAIFVAMNMMPKKPVVEVPKPVPVKLAKPVIVYRAKKHMPPKTVIEKEMVDIYSTFDTDPVYINLGGAGITSENNLIGREVSMPMQPQQGFTSLNVRDKQPFIPKRLSEAIPPGKRAITIAVNVIQSVGGFVREGDYVDIVGIFSDKSIAQPIRTILSGVQVISIGSELPTGYINPADANAPNPNAPQSTIKATPVQQITFAATQEESEIITLVTNSGNKMTFSLLLRSKTEMDERARAKGPVKEMVVDGKTQEISILKPMTKQEALDIFSGKVAKTEPASGVTDINSPDFNPDAMFDPTKAQSPRSKGRGKGDAKAAAPQEAASPMQAIPLEIEIYKGTNKSTVKFSK